MSDDKHLSSQILLDLIKHQADFSGGLKGALEKLGEVVMSDREILGRVIKMVEQQNQVLKMLADTVGELCGENKPEIKVPQIPDGWGIISDQ